MWKIYVNNDLAATHITDTALDDVTEDYVYALTEEHGPMQIEVEDDEDRFDRYINFTKLRSE